MRRMILASMALLAALTLDACGGGRPIRYYTVELPAAPEPTSSAYPIALAIGHIGAPETLQGQPIVYRSGRNEIGVYQYHLWAEPPVQMLKVMLIRRLRASGKYQSVAQLGSSGEGDFVLQGRLYDFEEVDTASVAALVSMEFELIDRRTRKTVWTHFYSDSEPVEGKEISEVVSALDRNLERGLTELASGLNAYFSANLTGKT
jgi:ABC-type uncharacterized transport system auxiliary subunit